jgi:hypothetical protein
MKTYLVQKEQPDGEWRTVLKSSESDWAHQDAAQMSNLSNPGGGIRIVERCADARGESVIWQRGGTQP